MLHLTFIDIELVTLIFGVHLKSVLIVYIFCAAGFKMCLKHLCFRVCTLCAAAYARYCLESHGYKLVFWAAGCQF